jgi:hypothetical protein
MACAQARGKKRAARAPNQARRGGYVRRRQGRGARMGCAPGTLPMRRGIWNVCDCVLSTSQIRLHLLRPARPARPPPGARQSPAAYACITGAFPVLAHTGYGVPDIPSWASPFWRGRRPLEHVGLCALNASYPSPAQSGHVPRTARYHFDQLPIAPFNASDRPGQYHASPIACRLSHAGPPIVSFAPIERLHTKAPQRHAFRGCRSPKGGAFRD